MIGEPHPDIKDGWLYAGISPYTMAPISVCPIHRKPRRLVGFFNAVAVAGRSGGRLPTRKEFGMLWCLASGASLPKGFPENKTGGRLPENFFLPKTGYWVSDKFRQAGCELEGYIELGNHASFGCFNADNGFGEHAVCPIRDEPDLTI